MAELHAFLTSVVNGGVWSSSRSHNFSPVPTG